MFYRTGQRKKLGQAKIQSREQRKMKGQSGLGPEPWVRKEMTIHKGVLEPAPSLPQVPRRKQKSIFVGSLQVFLCMASHYAINMLHSDKHDRTMAIPIEVSPALASCANTGKALSNSRCPESFPLALSRWPQITPPGFRYIYPDCGGPKSIHNDTS